MILTRDQISKLAGPSDERLVKELEDWLIIRLLLNGLTMKELLELKPEDFSWADEGFSEAGVVWTGRRNVHVDHVTVKMLPIYLEAYGGEHGEPIFQITESGVKQMLLAYGEKMGLSESLTVTALRKTCLARYVQEPDPQLGRLLTLQEITVRMGYGRKDYTISRIRALGLSHPRFSTVQVNEDDVPT